MPTWVCPFCRARMTVKETVLGQRHPCVKCGQESTVEDEAFVEALSPLAKDFRAAHPKWQAPEETRSTQADNDDVQFGGWAKLLCLGTAVICGIGILVNAGREPGAAAVCLMGCVSTVMTASILWPFCTLVNDVHAIRRRIERDDKS